MGWDRLGCVRGVEKAVPVGEAQTVTRFRFSWGRPSGSSLVCLHVSKTVINRLYCYVCLRLSARNGILEIVLQVRLIASGDTWSGAVQFQTS